MGYTDREVSNYVLSRWNCGECSKKDRLGRIGSGTVDLGHHALGGTR